MTKPCINYIERRRDGSLLVDYHDGNAYKHRIFYGYSKREAIQTLRRSLEIKRNPSAIRDYTVAPKRSLSELLVDWHQFQAKP